MVAGVPLQHAMQHLRVLLCLLAVRTGRLSVSLMRHCSPCRCLHLSWRLASLDFITDLPMTKHLHVRRHHHTGCSLSTCKKTWQSHRSDIRNLLHSPTGRLQGSPSQRCGQRHTLEGQRLSVLNYPKQLAHVNHCPQT
jgi:hypothetical protein